MFTLFMTVAIIVAYVLGELTVWQLIVGILLSGIVDTLDDIKEELKHHD